MRNDERDDLDRLLDEGLASYTQAEPRPGLEGRVLRRVLKNEKRKWWMAAWLIPAVAAVAVLLLMARTATEPIPPLHVRVVTPSVVRIPVGGSEVPRGLKSAPPKSTRRPLPRRRQFPTPSPMTEGERALLTFAARHPEQATELAADLRKSADPIQIGELQIDRLQNGN